jgi:hypothetical protein
MQKEVDNMKTLILAAILLTSSGTYAYDLEDLNRDQAYREKVREINDYYDRQAEQYRNY